VETSHWPLDATPQLGLLKTVDVNALRAAPRHAGRNRRVTLNRYAASAATSPTVFLIPWTQEIDANLEINVRNGGR
jgi:hypothetical protein